MNLRWLPAPELVEEADRAPWEMRGARFMRRLNYSTQMRTSFGGALMFALGSISAFLAVPVVHQGRTALIVAATLGSLVAITLMILVLTLDPPRLMRAVPATALPVLPTAGLLISVALAAVNESFAVFAILYVEAPLLGFYMYRRLPATILAGSVAVEYAAVLAWQEVPLSVAIAQWFVVVTTVAATGMLIGAWAASAEVLGTSEHVARLELAELNATLEQQVSEQVGELDRLGRLRRFLSPQIAGLVLSERGDELLRPHRRRIAVLFCDLRGFTAFTNRAEPEEVVQVLDEYYRSVGQILRERDATIGSYAGDGIMAYFGDPVPQERPSENAVAAASVIAPALDDLCRAWGRRGHDLGYGIGLACGYATLGTVGFDGRYDYTPLGAVVNLASRLCARASHRQILLDHATWSDIDQDGATVDLGTFDIKGFGPATKIYALEPKR